MRRALLLATLFGLAMPALAGAQVRLPDGSIVPRDSANGEVQLYSLFSSRGEPVDWITDARATPDVFSPLCEFTATLLLHEAGSSLGVGWYNADPARSAPPTEVYEILPPGTAVGTTITGTSIRADPRYAGGLIGLALMRSPMHFTEARYNTVCSAGPCAATPGPWILSVSYPSRVTTNAWYVAFEDGDTSSSSWNNDGDYNDYVFFFTGLACAGAGSPCDTGAPGICGSGLTECDTGGTLVCRSTTSPTTERCNGADDDCNGSTDEGDLCPPGEICRFGSCRPPCFEGSCAPGETCSSTEGICLEDACVAISCGEGERCSGGACVGVCDGVVCPAAQVCLGGRCSDPCAGVTCAAGRVCDRGVCVEGCSCRPCGAGLSCDASGGCVDPLCVGVSCSGGSFCRGGACVDACEGAVCPEGQICTAGECVDVPPGTDGGVIDEREGGLPDAGVVGPFDGGRLDAGRGRPIAMGSCGCRAIGRGQSSGALGIALALALLLARRR